MPLSKEERDYLKQLGGTIVRIRKEKGMKQNGLSDILDIDDGSLRRLESGRTNPTTITLLRVANALEIQVEDLFCFDKDS